MRTYIDNVPVQNLLTTGQLAQLLGVHQGTLRSARSRKTLKLPYVRVGRAIRYRPEDVAAFIEANRNGGAA